jgi:hypothetical protein
VDWQSQTGSPNWHTAPGKMQVLWAHPPDPVAGAAPVQMTYTNWRGETAERAIIPARVWFGSTDWHPEPQWFLKAMDTEKGEMRDFALKDFGRPEPGAGAAQIKVAWPEDARSLLAEADARIAWESLGFGADFAERVEAALKSDPPEEIGILQARLEGLGREWADLMRQLQGQPRRQSDVNADTWQPIVTAPKDRVIDLWSEEGGRYPDAIWDVHCGVEGWTDANDHRSLEGYRFTHWMERPAGPKEGGE